MEAELTELQRKVLERYSRLAALLHSLDDSIKQLNESKGQPGSGISSEQILKEMREIEVKIGLIGTLIKGSVFQYILQRQNGDLNSSQ